MAYKRKRVVLVSMPGLIQHATRSTLIACPEVDLIATASGALSATSLLSKMQPDLLLIDTNLTAEEMEALLAWAAAHCPSVQCVVATATSQQSDRALLGGADATIHRAGLADQLPETLRHLATCELQDAPIMTTEEYFE